MKIALAHFRVGETDGVSLEMDKWKIVLEKLGHEVVFLAGNYGSNDTYVIEELNYMHPFNNKIVYNAYEQLVDYDNELSLMEDIFRFSEIIEKKLIHFIEKEQIEVIITSNIFSLGWGLSAAIAFYNAIEKTNIHFIGHHHDFYWERERYGSPTCDGVKEIVSKYFPPKLKNSHHVVINQIAKEELMKRRKIESTVIPNVFDFNSRSWEIDQYNSDFREQLGLNADDVVILQATRITERKAIELGIEVVGEMQKPENIRILREKGMYKGTKFFQDPKLVYILAGMPESSYQYLELLRNKAISLGVDMRIVNNRIGHSRAINQGKKIYSLWDSYANADLIMYPSILEGWGNQLLEAVFAKKPTVIYQYPVYKTDIADKGFLFISLGDYHTIGKNGLVQVHSEHIKKSAKQSIDILSNSKLYSYVTETNFSIGKKYYSYEVLMKKLEMVLHDVGHTLATYS